MMNIGKSKDEFRPISQHGRMNIINCNSCCGSCNSSKNDLCGKELVHWIKNKGNKNRQIPEENINKLLEWYYMYEKYMIIPINLYIKQCNKTYKDLENNLDEELNIFYKKMKLT